MSTRPLPPGPRLSLFGKGARELRLRQHEYLLTVARDYGGLARVRVGPLSFVLASDPAYIHEILVRNQRNLVKGAAFHIMKRTVLGNGLVTSEGELHLRQRRLSQPAFNRQRIAEYSDTMTTCARQVADGWKPGQTVDVLTEMSRIALAIVTRALFGFSIGDETEQVTSALTEVLTVWRWESVPLVRFLQSLGIPYRGNRRLRQAKRRLDAVLERIINERRASGESRNDLLSTLLNAVDHEGDGQRMSVEQLRDETVTLMVAGYETVATTLTWAWYMVSQNPHVEARLHRELQEVLGDRDPTFADYEKLTYLRSVFGETMRMYPAVWVLSRRALCDLEVGPYRIPKNTHILACPYVTQRDPSLFPEPERFLPERWTPEFERGLPDMAYFPFGAGIRRCLGEPFVWTEGPLVMAVVAQRWKLRHDDQNPVVPGHGFLLRPSRRVMMTLEPRDRSVDQGVARNSVEDFSDYVLGQST